MDFYRLTTRYRQFGGIRLVWEYARMDVLPTIFVTFLRCLVKRKSFKAIYPEVVRKVEPFLIDKYSALVLCKKEEVRRKELEHVHPKVIWFCWLQGLENAPDIVKVCYHSVERHLVKEIESLRGSSEKYEIKVIDGKNWRDYVGLPDYIVRKWEEGRIPAALLSDLLRLQLLIRYGGTWIDSTVLCCTGGNGSKMKEYLEANLFLFQYTPPGCEWSGNISNWFISAHSNNEVLMVLRDMLFVYWKDYDCTLDYYMFHLFFKLVAKEYPEQIAAMPYGYSMWSLTLLHHWGERFNQEKWDRLTEKVSFHKLAFRTSESVKQSKDDYYNWIISNYTN